MVSQLTKRYMINHPCTDLCFKSGVDAAILKWTLLAKRLLRSNDCS